jgi:hydroxypyruvate isomerase
MPRFSANLVMLWTEVPFLDRFRAAASAGFDAVEYMFPYDFDPEDLRRALDRHGLEQDLFNLPAGDFAAGERGTAVDPARVDEFAAGVDSAMRYAAALGCRKLNCLVGTTLPDRPWGEQYRCLVDNLSRAVERMGAEGMTLHVELLNPHDAPGFFLDSVRLVERLLSEVPGLSFQCDLYHLQRTSGELTGTIRAMGGAIGHVQLADAPDRHEPGTGEINVPFVLGELDSVGYRGRIGLEYRPSGRTEDSFGWIEGYGYRRDGGVPAGEGAA